MNPGHMDHTEPVSKAGPAESGYETRDANIFGLLTFGVGLVVALVVVELLTLGFYKVFQSDSKAERPKPVTAATPENLYQQLRDLRSNEDKALGGYGWVDRKQGVVRIPIDVAIDLVAEKGSPFGKGPKTELEMNSHGGTPVPDAGAGANPAKGDGDQAGGGAPKRPPEDAGPRNSVEGTRAKNPPPADAGPGRSPEGGGTGSKP